MSSQLPPNPNVSTFNSEYWNTTSTSLTQAEADTLYVKFPVSQPQAETFLGDVAVNGTLTFNEGFGTNFSVSETCGTRDLTVSNTFETSGGTTATFGGQATFNDNADFTGNITATNLTASGSIRANTSFVYPNSTVQSSAYTGGPAGSYTNSNITLDVDGKISAIANGSGGAGSQTLSQTLVLGNSAGSTSINMNNNAITNPSNITYANDVKIPSSTINPNINIGNNNLTNSIANKINIAIGSGIMTSTMTSTAEGNFGIGTSTLQGITSGANNLGIGQVSLGVTSGSNNIGIGYQSGQSVGTGSNNTIIGGQAGSFVSNQSNNTLIGKGANVSTTSISGATAIGANAIANASNQVMIGTSTNTLSIPATTTTFTNAISQTNSASAVTIAGPITANNLITANSNLTIGSSNPVINSSSGSNPLQLQGGGGQGVNIIVDNAAFTTTFAANGNATFPNTVNATTYTINGTPATATVASKFGQVGLVKLQTVTAAISGAATAVNFNLANIFTSAYSNYRIILSPTTQVGFTQYPNYSLAGFLGSGSLPTTGSIYGYEMTSSNTAVVAPLYTAGATLATTPLVFSASSLTNKQVVFEITNVGFTATQAQIISIASKSFYSNPGVNGVRDANILASYISGTLITGLTIQQSSIGVGNNFTLQAIIYGYNQL